MQFRAATGREAKPLGRRGGIQRRCTNRIQPHTPDPPRGGRLKQDRAAGRQAGTGSSNKPCRFGMRHSFQRAGDHASVLLTA